MNQGNFQTAVGVDGFGAREGEAKSQDWFYVDRGRRCGPVSAATLKALFEAGDVNEQTKLWTAGFGDEWKAFGQVRGLRGEAEPPFVPTSEISNFWLYMLIAVPIVMSLAEAVWIETSSGMDELRATWIGSMLFFVPNTIFALLDQKAVERSGRKDAVKGTLLWIFLFIPAYIFVRSRRVGLGIWPVFAWLVAFVGSLFMSEMLPRTLYMGMGVPTCDSPFSHQMIEEIYPTIPVNAFSSTVVDISNIQETTFSEQNGVRECSAVVKNSAGLETPINFKVSEMGDEIYYEVSFAGL